MKRIAGIAVSLLALGLPVSAGASGDFGCAPRWTLASRSYDSCGSRALLSPGNDTRVNLFYLLRDRQGASPVGLSYPKLEYDDLSLGHNFFSWRTLRQAYFPQEPTEEEASSYSGSRCISLGSGGEAFAAALQASRGLPSAERARLTQARGAIAQACSSSGTGAAPNWPSDIKSGPGREFLAYLQAADAFYSGQWDAARDGFAKLRSARDGWVAETAAYMLARTELNAAQAGSFDEYGSFSAEKVDKPMLGRARADLDNYLKRYGQGHYARSAQGLVRRTLWLAGDRVGLAREYERLLGAVAAASPGAADLVEEVDNKLLTGSDGKAAIDGPLLLATIDLMLMRESEEGGPPVIGAAQLAAQEASFAGRPELYGFVTASHAYYVEKDMPKVLRLIPDDARKPSYSPLAFSRQVLRGMALAAAKDRNEAGFWRELLGGADALYQRPLVELALALSYERSGKLAEVFAPGSPIGETAIREILLQYVAGPDLLRAQARNARRPQHERQLALFTLLQKELSQGDYAGFLRDSAQLRADVAKEGGVWDLRQQTEIPVGLFRSGSWSDGFACPALSATAATLARNPRDVKARLCLGDFYRLNGFDVFGGAVEAPKRDELGGTPSLFPGRPTPRGDIYADIIADPKVAGEDKAYALFRAVNCYAPSGYNGCGGADVAQSQRHAWFQRLKREFAASPWAQQLRYYW